MNNTTEDDEAYLQRKKIEQEAQKELQDREARNELVKEAKIAFKKAWKENEKDIKERLGGRYMPRAAWMVVEKAYELGFYKGLEEKIEYTENNG